jgi:putative ABC transport system permease protein
MALGGIAVGAVAALLATRLLSSMLYGVGATDPLAFVSVAGILTVVALLSSYLPARRATKVDPMVVLRYE